MMFQLASSDGSTGPRAFSTKRRVGIGALSELRERPAGAGGGATFGGSGGSRLVTVATAARRCHQHERDDDSGDPDPLHVPPPWSISSCRMVGCVT